MTKGQKKGKWTNGQKDIATKGQKDKGRKRQKKHYFTTKVLKNI